MSNSGTIGRYRIVREIGGGAMGRVLEAVDTQLDRKVAIKTLPIGAASSTEFQERFQREAKLAASLNHPNLVAVYDAGEDPGTHEPFIVMEMVEGQSLRELLSDRGPCRPAHAAVLVRQAAEGLHYAHERGIVHRDVKPGNLLVSKDGVLKVADFGIARPEVSAMTQTGQLMGTPHFMSPEQITGDRVDARADVFALGVVLYQLLTGEKPFSGETLTAISYRVVNTDPPPPSAIRPSVPAAFDAVVLKAIAKQPDDRFPDAFAFAEALRPLEQGAPPESTTGESAQSADSAGTVALPGTASGDSAAAAVAASVRRIPLAMAIVVSVVLVAGLLWLAYALTGGGGDGSADPAPPATTSGGEAGTPGDRPPPDVGSGSPVVTGGSASGGAPSDGSTPQQPPATSPPQGTGSSPQPEDGGSAPAGVPDVSGTITLYYSFRHTQKEGRFLMFLDGNPIEDVQLDASGMLQKEEVIGKARTSRGTHTVRAVLTLPDEDMSTPIELVAEETVEFDEDVGEFLFVKYHRFLGQRELKFDWDSPRAKKAHGL